MTLFRRPAVRQLTTACLLAAAACGAHAEAPRQNTVNFSATAHREVVQDELTVVLEAVKEGSQAAEVQAELKRVLEAALTEARALIKGAAPEAVSVQTGGFNLYPRYGNNSRITGWQGTAQLVLSGTDAGKVYYSGNGASTSSWLGEKLNRIREEQSQLSRLTGKQVNVGGLTSSGTLEADIVDFRFREYRRLATSNGSGPTPLTQSLQVLNEASAVIAAARQHIIEQLLQYVARQAAVVVQQLLRLDARLRQHLVPGQAARFGTAYILLQGRHGDESKVFRGGRSHGVGTLLLWAGCWRPV